MDLIKLLKKSTGQGKSFKSSIPQFYSSFNAACVDLTGNVLKIVYGKSANDKLTIHGAESQKFGDSPDEEISRYLATFFSSHKIDAERGVLFVLPSKAFILKNVDIPSTDRDEIAKIIDLQAGRFTPYSRDEIVIDFLCMETANQYYTSVLLVIVNRKVVEKYCVIFENAGIGIAKIGIISEGVAMTYGDMAGAEQEQHSVGGIHVSDDSSDLTILDKHQIIFVRNIPVGREHFTTDQASAEADFLDELSKSLTAYQNQGMGRPVKLIMLTGRIQGMDFLQETIRNSPHFTQDPDLRIRVVDPLTPFTLTEEALKTLGNQPAASYFEVMASLAFAQTTKIDLIPREIKLKRHFREGGREIITLGILIMTILMIISLFLASKLYFKSTLAKKLDEINQTTAEQAQLLERTSTKNRVVHRLLETRGKGLYVFDKVSALIGEDMYLSRFVYDFKGKIVIAGTADSMSRVFAFVTQLEESNYFTKVKTKETKSRREGKSDVADFELHCTLAEGV